MGRRQVPYYLVGKPNSKYGVVCARRAMMKAAMGLKTGLTGYGCAIGSYATISYPLSEEENLLLISMGSQTAGDDAPANA